MITAVLVDDMRPALRELEFLLKKYPDISIEGMYTDPLAAIERIGAAKPQAVFLDISMPQLQGMDAASRILELSPETDIVFVTAYDQYAVEAFELHAMDYLLKPITEERLEKTVERLRGKSPLRRERRGSKLQIRCFGRFRMGWEGQEPIKWRIEKARELFAYLLQNHGRSISKDELLDRLWPEDDPEKAVKQLYNSSYYIRKALNAYGIDGDLISMNSSYSLKCGSVDWDVERFCELFEKSGGNRSKALEEMEELYTASYLEGEFYPWSDFESERLSRLYDQCVLELSKSYIGEKLYDKAERVLLKAYNANPYLEEISELLLILYRESGNKGSAIRHFKTYADFLEKELGIKPEKKLQELIEQ